MCRHVRPTDEDAALLYALRKLAEDSQALAEFLGKNVMALMMGAAQLRFFTQVTRVTLNTRDTGVTRDLIEECTQCISLMRLIVTHVDERRKYVTEYSGCINRVIARACRILAPELR